MAKKILVIGGGISGLSVAYALKKKGIGVSLIEAKSRLGGVINTLSENGFRAESGSNSVMLQSQKTLDFIKEIGLDKDLVFAKPTAKKRFFVKNGKICEVPMSPPKMIFSKLFSFFGKFRLLKDLWTPSFDADADPSVDEFTIKRLGQEALDYGMNPFMAGVYGGDTSKLSARYACPAFWNLDQKYGSIIKGGMKARKEKIASGNLFKPVMISFKNGLVELVEKLSEHLKDNALTATKIVSIDYDMGAWRVCWTQGNTEDCDEFDEIIIAVPSNKLSSLPLPGSLEMKMAAIENIDYAPVNTITFGFKRSDIAHKLDGFGVLVPQKETKYRILGALFLSSIFDNRAPDDCVTITCYLGGKRNMELTEKSDEEQEKIALEDLQGLIGLRGAPIFNKVFKWKNAIAQYNVGYGEILEALAELEAEFPTIKLLGSYRGGVGVSACIENALNLAESYKDEV